MNEKIKLPRITRYFGTTSVGHMSLKLTGKTVPWQDEMSTTNLFVTIWYQKTLKH